jgi:small subunit ribosomal protein S13
MRLSGITLPNKRLAVALTAIYGIGAPRALQILKTAGVNPTKKTEAVDADEEQAIRKAVDSYRLEGALKREVAGNIKRLIDIKSYRGNRHAKKLPARGQRTRTNSRTRRGNVRKTMGSGRKTVEKK